MTRTMTGLVVLAACATLQAQSVADGYDAGLLLPAVVEDAQVWDGNPPAVGDFDEDGRDDLAVGALVPMEVARFLGQPKGGVGDKLILTLPAGAGFFGHPFSVDADGDGHLDLVVHGQALSTLSFLRGLGNGDFAPAVSAGTLPANTYLPVLGDLDGDALPDLVFATGGFPPHAIHWMKGQGNGTFASPVTIGTAEMPSQLLVADLDGDGLADLAHFDALQVAVRLGLGGGALGPPQHYSSYAGNSLVAADMDLDGEVDLVHAGGLDVATILHGLPGGGFGETLHVGLAPFARFVRAVDVEIDGLPDLVCTSAQPLPFLTARRMDHDGPIGASVSFPLPPLNGMASLALGDFDGDGLQDAACTDPTGFELLTLTNDLGAIVDLGFGVPSAQGTPSVAVFGTPAPGSLVSVQALAPAFPSPGFLVVGLQAFDLPFLGSTFVPSPDLVLPVDIATQYVATWPAGFPAGVAVYLQSVHSLVGGGKTISNAVRILSE